MTMRSFAEHGKAICLFTPRDVAAGDSVGVSLRNYQGAFLHVVTGTLANSVSIQLRQCLNVALSGIKDLNIETYFTQLTTASPQEESDRWDKVSQTANAVIALVASTQLIIPIRPGMLDVSNDFDCVALSVVGGGAGNDFFTATLFLHDGPKGIAGNIKHIPSARINTMSQVN